MLQVLSIHFFTENLSKESYTCCHCLDRYIDALTVEEIAGYGKEQRPELGYVCASTSGNYEM